MKHHPAGPSQFGRIVLCPGSLRLADRARANGQTLNPYAAEAQSGTDLHALLPPDAPIPDDIATSDREAVEAARAWIASHLAGATSIYYERHVSLESGIFGTVDILATWHDGSLPWIGDVKFGHAPLVASAIEWQMKLYASSRKEGCRVAVFKARDREEYTAEFSASDCRALRAEIRAHYVEADKDSAPLRSSPDACRYCPATGICPAFREDVLAPLEAPSWLAHELSTEEVARWLQLLSIVSAREDAIRERAKKIILDGGVVPGYQIKSMAIRKLPTKDILEKEVPPEALARAAKYTITDLERALGRTEFARILGPHIETVQQSRLERI